MAGALSLKIRGLDRTIKNLVDLDKIKIPKAIEKGLDAASEFVLTSLNANTPVDSGVLKGSNEIVEISNESRAIGPNLTIADYAPHVEYGHHTRSGSFVEGQFYIQKTSIETRNQVQSIFDTVFNIIL